MSCGQEFDALVSQRVVKQFKHVPRLGSTAQCWAGGLSQPFAFVTLTGQGFDGALWSRAPNLAISNLTCV